MTFSQDLYDPATYRRVPFITEKGRADFGMLLPGLKNASYGLDAEQKGLYHALCVMSGNFTVLLWEKAFKEFETLGLPRMTLLPYLERIALNLISSRGQSVLTGPLARGDGATIANNIEALDGDKFQDVYRAFVSATQNTIPTNAQSEGDVL
ncbi:MAG TPA: DUF2520 domain-containing protein, partial [Bdellovibrionales bacterium]|nr:DUF2520 domain-containing protein [Bdellovibrionales bacterium]